MAGWFKILGQVGLGIIVGATLYFNNKVVVWREYYDVQPTAVKDSFIKKGEKKVGDTVALMNGKEHRYAVVKTPITTIPFVKSHEFNYSRLISWTADGAEKYTWVIYIIIVIFIVTAVSNGANITDGLDGLATGVSAIIGTCLGSFCVREWQPVLPNISISCISPILAELSIFIGAFVGACIGFLWYNSYPAQVFMGDTGSLTLGGIIASLAIIVRKELLIPIFCGVFLVELLSVMFQVSYFKYTKKKYGEGKRIFLMSPLHHHYQKLGYHESKIVMRFWIVTVLCVLFAIATLKMR